MKKRILTIATISILFIGCGTIEIDDSNRTVKNSSLNSSNYNGENITEFSDSSPMVSDTIEKNSSIPSPVVDEDIDEVNSTIEDDFIVDLDNDYLPIPTPTPTSTSSTNMVSNQTDLISKFINSSNCSQIIDKEFFKICYDYSLKSAKVVAYSLYGDLVNELNIKERPKFYEEESISEPYRAKFSDYSGSGYDRGHLAPDASFDWSMESLEATYSLANIIPQTPEVNQKMWVEVEQYARDKAVELGTLNIINLIKYDKNPSTIGESQVAVSIGYYKILVDESSNYRECFYYSNDRNSSSIDDKLSYHKVNCDNII